MIKKVLILFLFVFIGQQICDAQQFFFRTADLFPQQVNRDKTGELNIYQERSMDTLLSRYIFSHKQMGGMQGFRVQIYRSGTRNARAEADKIMAEFINDYPQIHPHLGYEEPGYFLVRVGDFRTKIESTKYLYLIRKKYPNAYSVPCIIDFPDLNKK
jgi:hypothetical protein